MRDEDAAGGVLAERTVELVELPGTAARKDCDVHGQALVGSGASEAGAASTARLSRVMLATISTTPMASPTYSTRPQQDLRRRHAFLQGRGRVGGWVGGWRWEVRAASLVQTLNQGCRSLTRGGASMSSSIETTTILTERGEAGTDGRA